MEESHRDYLFIVYRPKKSLQFLDSPVMYLQVNYNPVMGLQF